MGKLTEVWRDLKCRFGFHPRLQVIQHFGSAQHIGCPHCRRHYAIHHGMRVVLPWDSDFASLYEDMGYDTHGAHQRWLARLSALEGEG